MTSSRPGARKQATRHRGPWSEISAWLVRAWRGWMKHRAQAQSYRRDVKALSELGDHQLKDIGLNRGEIESVVAQRLRQGPAKTPPPHRPRHVPSPTARSTQASGSAS